MTRRRLLLFPLLFLPLGPLVAQSPASQKPYVVLVSLDGFRYDYAERYHATNILALGKAGATAKAMVPSFPSVTFPNHISIVTGMYPGHHGIVGNSFFDPERKARYGMKDAPTEGAFMRAKPLWVVAEEQHVKSACMFWPMSDSEIMGVRPSYWKQYDGSVPNLRRVTQVLDWLTLPESERPHFITLYFSDVDSAGHSHGPDSAEVEQAVQRLDKLIGALWAGIQTLPLPVNLIVVSDHGMQTVGQTFSIGDLADFSKVQVVNNEMLLSVYAPDAAAAESLYQSLKGKSDKFEIYRRKETPARWHYSEDPRIGDLVIMAKGPNLLNVRPPNGGNGGRGNGGRGGGGGARGAHGFDPAEFPTMNAIFYAAGPNIKPGEVLEPFENVNVFPFVTKVLGLTNPPNLDGSESALAGIYRQ
ncbi:MAG TPA: ectonucleotide pyrophosphatase/phosphodiesterase [Verrucomicrobiae bacterium]|nr:ectonucleotide pyrophosphatase/phosphodiesterase [Verrucomicrobiae bacterium]